jgi:DNA-binding NarL/FixJ family response regulator
VASSGNSPETPIRVVIVDDHEMLRESVARLLAAQWGLDVVATAATGIEAIALAGELRPDVLLVDYGLPDINGVEVIRQVTSADPAVRAVLFTGLWLSHELVAAAIYAGCSRIFEKTRLVAELAETIRRAATDEVLVQRAQLVALARGGTASAIALSPREGEILALVAEGRGTKDIASLLGLSLNSVRNHVQRLLVKLDAHSKLEAVVNARRRGLL